MAKEVDADVLIIDEKRGRLVAEEMGIKCIGLVGILVLAKQQGLLSSLEDILDRLENEANFYLAASVKRKMLITTDEWLRD